MFRRICSIIICAIVAVECSQEVCNPNWNTPDLPYQLLSQLPVNWDQQNFRQSNILSELSSAVVNKPELEVIGNARACEQNQVIRQPTIVTPPVVKTIRLPVPNIQRPRVISNTCTCTKTVLVPQVYQRVIKVPSTIRYIKKSYVPVIEKIKYNGCGKVGCESCAQEKTPLEIPQSAPFSQPEEWVGQPAACEECQQPDWSQAIPQPCESH